MFLLHSTFFSPAHQNNPPLSPPVHCSFFIVPRSFYILHSTFHILHSSLPNFPSRIERPAFSNPPPSTTIGNTTPTLKPGRAPRPPPPFTASHATSRRTPLSSYRARRVAALPGGVSHASIILPRAGHSPAYWRPRARLYHPTARRAQPGLLEATRAPLSSYRAPGTARLAGGHARASIILPGAPRCGASWRRCARLYHPTVRPALRGLLANTLRPNRVLKLNPYQAQANLRTALPSFAFRSAYRRRGAPPPHSPREARIRRTRILLPVSNEKRNTGPLVLPGNTRGSPACPPGFLREHRGVEVAPETSAYGLVSYLLGNSLRVGRRFPPLKLSPLLGLIAYSEGE